MADAVKSVLRRQVRARRDAMTPAARRAAEQAVVSHLERILADLGARCLGLYAATGSELDIGGLGPWLRSRDGTVAYPRCVPATGELDFVPVERLADLRPGAFGIREPSGEALALSALDAVVVPGLAFDRAGRRLGYGAGYYDRTLRRCPAHRIGAAFELQLEGALPEEPHDLRMDTVVTEGGIWASTGGGLEVRP